MKRHDMCPGWYWFKGTASWRSSEDGYEFNSLAQKEGVVVFATASGEFLLAGSGLVYGADMLDGVFVGPLLIPSEWVDCRAGVVHGPTCIVCEVEMIERRDPLGLYFHCPKCCRQMMGAKHD